MFIKRIGILFLVVSALLPAATPANAADCKLKQAASLDLTADNAGNILLPVSIAGSPHRLLLSFQAAFSVLNDATVTSLNLQRKPMPEGVGVNRGNQHATGLALAKIQLDQLAVDNVNFVVLPEMPADEQSADGVIGLDVLRSVDAELDLASSKLILFMQDHCPGRVVHWQHPGGVAAIPMVIQKSGNIRLKMQLDGKTIDATLVEGSTRMGMNALRRIFSPNKDDPGLQLISGGGATGRPPSYRYAFKKLEAPGIEVDQPEIFIYDEDPGQDCDARTRFKIAPNESLGHEDLSVREYRCYGGADLFLGQSILRRLHLYFAFGEKMLYATAIQPENMGGQSVTQASDATKSQAP